MIYSIADLEQLSGVSAHTIRIWERRYNALSPSRSAGNTRHYDDTQLRKLLNIVSLNQSGLKISKICSMGQEAIDNLIQQEINKTIPENAQYEYYISAIISHGLLYNEPKTDELLTLCIRQYGLVQAYKNILYPLLVRLGLMWGKDSVCPSQEHFLSCLIRQKIFFAINALPFSTNPRSCWLLFLPEDEDHDIGLMIANYMLRSAGQRVIYLGSKTPLSAVKNVLLNADVDHILFFLTGMRPLGNSDSYLEELEILANKIPVYISGNVKITGELTSSNISLMGSITDFEKIIAAINQPTDEREI